MKPHEHDALDQEIIETIRRKLKHYRHQRGWTQEDLARAAGLPWSTVNAIEQGRSSPRMRTLVLMARALDIAPSELLAGL